MKKTILLHMNITHTHIYTWYIRLAVKDDTQYRSAEVFVTIPRENIIDQNTVQHCRQEVGNCVNQSVGDDEPDVLIIKEERPDNMRCEQPGGETKTAENRE